MTRHDRTNDSAGEFTRRGGLLKDLSNRQSDIRELLADIRATEDKTVEDGLAGNLGYDDDKIIAVVLSVVEMDKDPDREITVRDLIWAGAFLDHLDTQGLTVRMKARRLNDANLRP